LVKPSLSSPPRIATHEEESGDQFGAVVTPGTDFSKLYLLAVREAAGGFAGTVGYMVKPCITVIVYGRICACLYHRGEALALKHGAGGCGSAFPSALVVIGLVALVGGW
jgi:hypothetical protein